MSEHSDLKKQFEVVLGQELGEDWANEIEFRESFALYYWTAEGHVVSRDLATGHDSSKRCNRSSVLTIGGYIMTGQDGTAEHLLSEFYCGRQGNAFSNIRPPAFLVATPRSSEAVFATARAFPTHIDGRPDAKLSFLTWQGNGKPASRILVAWHCLVAVEWPSIQ